MQEQWAGQVFFSSRMFFATLAINYLLILSTADSKGEFKCSSGKYKSICLRDDYSSFDLPNADTPNEILVSINVDEVLNINNDDHSILFSTYFNVEWNEARLYVAPDLASQQDGFKPFSEEVLADLWMPNIFIYSLKSFTVMNVFSSLSGLWIDSTKAVLYSKASHISFFCPINFASFLLETQHCQFLVGPTHTTTTTWCSPPRKLGTVIKQQTALLWDLI